MKIGLLVSQPSDMSWQRMYRWIRFYGHEPIVFYDKELIENDGMCIDFSSVTSIFLKSKNGDIFDLDQIDFFFRRQWNGNLFEIENPEDKFRHDELLAIRNFILDELHSRNKLFGYASASSLLKLKHLSAAKKIGLNIPYTMVTNRKNLLYRFHPEDKLVLKNIQTIYVTSKKNETKTSYTNLLSYKDIESSFFQVIVQENIKKKCELRVFCFNETCYSIAGISNKFDDEVDIRKLSSEGYVEYYPYDLPIQIKNRIVRLLKILNLKMASIDLTVDSEENYHFLDLNPFGQIAMVSNNCFPNIERDIVQHLIKQII